MAAACTPTPTLTRTDVTTSESSTTTVSVVTSTLPGSVSTSVFRTCVAPTGSITSPCVVQVATSFFTFPGNTTLVTVPVTVPVEIPITQVVTLFGSSCSNSITTTPADSVTTTPTPSLTDSSTTTTTTPDFTVSTPPPSLITSSSIVTSDGSTYVAVFTSTSTLPPTTVSSTGGPTSSALDTANANNHKKSNNAGAIAGGVVAGLAALLFLGFLTWKLIKKQSGFDNIFNGEDRTQNTTGHYKKRVPESKPYDYGMIGQQNANPINITPPSSPPPTQGTFGNDVGQQGTSGNDVGQQGNFGNNVGQQPPQTTQGQGPSGNFGNNVGQQPPQITQGQGPAPPNVQHLRNPSLTPLLAGVAAVAGAAGAASAVNSSASRPSTSGSSQPSGPQITSANTQGQGYPPTQSSSYPPALQNWAAANQGYGSVNPAGVTTNAQGFAPGAGSQAAGPSSSMGHNPSAGSVGSIPSTYSTSSSGAAGAYNVGVPALVPVIVGAGVRNNNRQQQQQQQQRQQQQQQQYEDPFARTGSPVSLQEQRILQVTNAEPSSPLYPPTPARQSYIGASYYANQPVASSSSSSSAVAGPSGSSNSSQPSSSGVDGKGRPLNTRGEKAPLVHLDGGLYQEPAPDAELPASPAPPAYAI
ncbi:hypothetical protein BDZ97DRAFT_2055649 [Flammula alnicola]|nr:hypothetical protein BDZ97DRAFT_2055649 [Flammula alnicola]